MSQYQPIDLAAFRSNNTPKNGTPKPIQEVAKTHGEQKELTAQKIAVSHGGNGAAIQAAVEADLEHAISQLESRRVDLTTDYGDWVKLGFAFASLGEKGRAYYHRISSMYAGYDYEECEKQFNISHRKHDGRTNIASFFQHCKDAGVNISPTAQREIDSQPKLPKLPKLPSAQPTPAPAAELTEAAILDYLNESEIDFSEELAPPPVCLEVVQGSTSAIIGTRGNFSLVIGKAKSRKTFFITIALAAAINSDPVLGIFRGSLPADKSNVLYFDTEQGKYHVQKAARRVLRLSGNHTPDNFRAYGLRKYNPQERLQIIDTAINNVQGVGLVVIDGVRDLVSSINDEELATMLASKLLKWTEEKELHIVCVLHQNKGDNNARGHLGTELQNKAETVLSITKDKESGDMSIVEAEYCREREFEPFAFEIDDQGLPMLVDHLELRNSAGGSTSKSLVPIDWPEETHREVLAKVFGPEKHPRYRVLVSQVKLVLNEYGVKIGDNKAKDFVQFYQSQNYITHQGKERSKDCFYHLVEAVV